MAHAVKPPENLNLVDGNVAANWKRFKRQLDYFLRGSSVPMNETGDNKGRRVAILLSWAGEAAQDVYDTFTFNPAAGNVPAEKNDDYDIVLTKFEEYCVARKNIVFERCEFNSRKQKEGESVDSYVTALRIQADLCEFGELKESMIRDRLVVGILVGKLRVKMLEKPKLTLAQAITFCKANEVAQRQDKVLNNIETEQVNYVNRAGPSRDISGHGPERTASEWTTSPK